METNMLQSTLTNLGALLAISFGEAGSQVIATNLAKGADINPNQPGYKQLFIFGYCNINGFNDTIEVLNEEVIIFANLIGQIVHSTVDKYQGSANKNSGDAYLLVWRF